MSKRKYNVGYYTNTSESTSTISPEVFDGFKFWYDTGEKLNGEPVLKDNLSGAYSLWNDGEYWNVTSVSDVGVLPVVNGFIDNGAGGLVGTGTYTGGLTLNTPTIVSAWYRAESTAFDSLANFSGCVAGVDCFRGFLPIQGDGTDYEFTNVWQMSSGSSGEFDIDRLSGEDPCWGTLRVDAYIDSIWATREDAMNFAGLIEAWLIETGNLMNEGNITECRLMEIPDEPTEYFSSGVNRKRFWKQEIRLEIIYSTM